MKRKLVLTLGFAGVLALSVGFAENLQSTKVSAEEQPKLAEQTDTTKVITKEEQNMVETSSAKEWLYHKKTEQNFILQNGSY